MSEQISDEKSDYGISDQTDQATKMDLELVPQHAAFRKTLLFYLKTNANPKLLIKLLSKYFCFNEFPFFVIRDLTNVKEAWSHLPLAKMDDLKIATGDDYEAIDINDLEKPLWITSKLLFYFDQSYSSTFIGSELIQKLAVCDMKELYISGQILTMKEFEFLVSAKTVEIFSFRSSEVQYPDGNIVPVDEIIKFMPKLKKFSWFYSEQVEHASLNFTPQTTKKLIEYLNPSILTQFVLCKIPENFDMKLFGDFIHKHPSINWVLRFNGPPISDAYSNMLQNYVDKLIETGAYKTRRIIVDFPNLSDEQRDILQK